VIEQPKSSRVFVVKLRPLPHCTDPIKALRSALKTLLRRFGLRCIEISETTNTNVEAQSGALFSDKTQ
jgi:hypothetical protein